MLDSLAAVPLTSVQGAASVSPDVTTPAPSATPADPKNVVEHLSPSLQLDPEVGIVVIQYRSASGRIELSIPSQQQLDAYRADPSAAIDDESSTRLA